ncbi:MAG: hypothetical protein IPL47_10925 [Phyllobacteriaceae bacterium]|nr:hypothetical protein [Phyllobacteriaceae bacterium]
MAGILRSGEEKTGARYEYRARISTRPERKRPPSRIGQRAVFIEELQSFQLGLSRLGRRRETLAMRASRRLPLLAKPQNPGAQTIQFERETL